MFVPLTASLLPVVLIFAHCIYLSLSEIKALQIARELSIPEAKLGHGLNYSCVGGL
jgi:hypothetical protein